MLFQRSQLIVMFRATMSTLPSCSTGIRWALEITRSSIFGEPKIAVATAFSMSMSKPSIAPVIGLREPSSKVSAETPAIKRPRALIWAIVEPAVSAAGPGSGPVGAYDASGLPQFWLAAGGAAEAAGVGVVFAGSGVASYAL